MLNIDKTQRVTYWKTIESKERYTVIKVSSSRKDKKLDKYVNSSWLMRLVGTAHEKASSLNERDRITISAVVSKEPYTDQQGAVKYPEQPQITVFDFEPVISAEHVGVEDSHEVVASSSDDLPF